MLSWRMKRKIDKAIQASMADVVTKQSARVDLRGNAIIPPGTRRINHGAFDGNPRLRRVVLPDSVKTLSERAFAACVNLEQVQLNEGLETIESNAFYGCSKLKTLVLPDSLKNVHGYAFHGTEFLTPVYNRSRTVLYHHPGSLTEKTIVVPDHVKCLSSGAFFDHKEVQEVILPEGLETIDSQAFLETSLRRITIPASVTKIGSEAFWKCPELEEVDFRCALSALERGVFYKCPKVQFKVHGEVPDFEQELWIRGVSLLEIPRHVKVPESSFWKNKTFTALAARCAEGDTGAMLEFAHHFEGLGDALFYQCAANFWRYRAFQYGDPRAEEWKRNWIQAHPQQRIPSVLPASLNWNIDGSLLRALGFLFFEPDREYSLEGVDKNGVVQVSSWCDSDGPDEDGFGREEYYDWWYLDEHLNRIPGVRCIESCSRRDSRLLVKSWFEAEYAKAVKAVQHKLL